MHILEDILHRLEKLEIEVAAIKKAAGIPNKRATWAAFGELIEQAERLNHSTSSTSKSDDDK